MERNGQCTLIKPAVSQVINGFWQSHETCKTWNVLADLRHPPTIQGLSHVEIKKIEAVKGSKPRIKFSGQCSSENNQMIHPRTQTYMQLK